MVTKAEAAVSVQHIAQSDLPQIMMSLFVVSALQQLRALIGAGHVGVEVGRIISQQPPADHVLLLPQAEEPHLRFLQLLLGDAIEAVPKLLRAKPLRWEAPQRTQDGAVIPSGDFRFGAGLADAMDG